MRYALIAVLALVGALAFALITEPPGKGRPTMACQPTFGPDGVWGSAEHCWEVSPVSEYGWSLWPAEDQSP
jgi:hypothetical protein